MVTTRVGAGRATSSCAKSFAATAASRRARAHGRGRARPGPLLASTSLAALLIGVGSPAAFAQPCTGIDVTTHIDGSVVNTSPTAIDCIGIRNGATVTGNVTNPAGGVITGGPAAARREFHRVRGADPARLGTPREW